MTSPQVLANYAAVLSAIVGLVLLFKSLREYQKQGAQKRADYFRAMIDKFKTTPDFLEISALLDEKDDPKLAKIHYRVRRSYLNFFEELALMVNSGLVQKELALYMFGYYAIQAHRNKYFRDEFAFDGPYWSLFVKFANEMEALQDSPKFKRGDFKF
jgi:hypothetical protein